MIFPQDFSWGVATAAYQIEGAVQAGNRGASIWDRFCERPGAVVDGSSGAVACDHYHRCEQDIQLMQSIGCQAYRFSIAWPRVQPSGKGQPNPEGLAFYDRLVDLLLSAGMTPFATLYHWDLPQALQDDRFAEYTAIMVSCLSDRVVHWITLNEPQCFIGLGYHTGQHAPGMQLGWEQTLLAAHHSLLAHGKAAQAARAAAVKPVKLGIAMVGSVTCPMTEDKATIEAAKEAAFASNGNDLWNNAWFADPIFLGHYPEDGSAIFKEVMPETSEYDLSLISQPLDFYGANIYRGDFIRINETGASERVPLPYGYARSAYPYWAVTPEALYWGPLFYYERYKTPIYITENGFSSTDWVALDGKVHDPQRVDFTARYLQALLRAIHEGCDVRGYFHWTLLDNFEWGEGFNQRFGLIHVDFNTQARTLKDSAIWYRSLIKTNGAILSTQEAQAA
mgnify:CR=1 FL=1